MGNNVFANGREVSCKAADGKSICCFPDVCMTPPENPATPPGVPVPYPNTGMASDTTGGSKHVKVSKKEVMLKNKSSFKKSMGDEAGSAAKKGVVTSKNMGKVYFNAWSMDVKFEGENIVRHLDLTTHNHSSAPGNTPPWGYMDTMNITVGGENDPCKSTREDVKEKCKACQEENTYSTGRINQKGMNECMCKDNSCKKARKCVLTPYKSGCCDGKTPHHVVPAHCFMPPGARGSGGGERYSGCEKYNVSEAPCVCVTGEDKSNKRLQHARIHALFDDAEDAFKKSDGSAGTWSYNQAATAGAESVSDVMGCDENCTKAQLNRYHEKHAGIKKGTKLRADSSGQSKPPTSLSISTPSAVIIG